MTLSDNTGQFVAVVSRLSFKARKSINKDEEMPRLCSLEHYRGDNRQA